MDKKITELTTTTTPVAGDLLPIVTNNDTTPVTKKIAYSDLTKGQVTANGAITGATHTKITYDVKGLVTSGADANQDDFADGTTNKAYTSTEKSKLSGIAADATANAKAAYTDIDTGTDDALFATSAAIANSKISKRDKTETLTNKTVVQRVASYSPTTSPQALDLSTGNIQSVTMYASLALTLSISNGTVGQCFLVEINNVTSQGALTWFSTIRWAGGTPPTLTGTNGTRDVFGFRISGSGTYDGYVVGQNI